MPKTHYEVLGVPEQADAAAIKKAYYKLAMQYHPDKHAEKPLEEQKVAEAKFKEIGHAAGILQDPEKRAEYDAELAAHRNPQAAHRAPQAAQQEQAPKPTPQQYQWRSAQPTPTADAQPRFSSRYQAGFGYARPQAFFVAEQQPNPYREMMLRIALQRMLMQILIQQQMYALFNAYVQHMQGANGNGANIEQPAMPSVRCR
jgi:DnaJ-class molecular chaperone